MRPPEQTRHDAAPSTDGVIDGFEDAWRAGHAPNIAEVLEKAASNIANDELRRALLYELICVDLEYRWNRPGVAKAGAEFVSPRTLEDYVAAHPELGQINRVSLELIADEYRVRHRWGDRPTHAEYISRFGERAGQLAAVLRQVDAELAGEVDVGDRVDAPLAARTKRPPRLAEYDERAPLDYRDFTLQLHLGSGGIGKVYRARQRSLGRTVAVKMLKKRWLQFPAAVEQFLQEARTVARLRHPNIVGVHGLGRTPRGGYFIAMDWVDGRDLAEILAAGPVRVEDAADWVAQAADALHYAHRSGVIHCDLKPSNLLLDRTGKAFLTDFGFALPLERVRDNHCLGGTMGYLAPEQLAGDARALTPATDVYGLGGVLYTLLTGRRPFDDCRAWQSELLPELEAICRRCLAAEPRERYASAAELAKSLRELVRCQR